MKSILLKGLMNTLQEGLVEFDKEVAEAKQDLETIAILHDSGHVEGEKLNELKVGRIALLVKLEIINATIKVMKSEFEAVESAYIFALMLEEQGAE